ncbi:unnamed protein product, partial [Polarella glacialis]
MTGDVEAGSKQKSLPVSCFGFLAKPGSLLATPSPDASEVAACAWVPLGALLAENAVRPHELELRRFLLFSARRPALISALLELPQRVWPAGLASVGWPAIDLPVVDLVFADQPVGHGQPNFMLWGLTLRILCNILMEWKLLEKPLSLTHPPVFGLQLKRRFPSRWQDWLFSGLDRGSRWVRPQ